MVCLFFGSFNPIHYGHLALGRYAHECLGFDEVWFVLSPLNPQKQAQEQWPYEERVRLARLALAPYSYLKLVEYERTMPMPLFTWRTVQALRLLYPREDFALLIGSDNLLKIKTWARWEYLLSLISLYVYPRPGYEVRQSTELEGINYTLCTGAPEYDISSTLVRAGLRKASEE